MGRIIFKFAGGPLDGKAISGDPAKDSEVRRYYALTHHGRLGQRFRTASEYAINVLAAKPLQEEAKHHFQPHVYEVVDHIRNGSILLVRMEYVQKAANPG